MRVTGAKPKRLEPISKMLLAPDLLTPATPLTPDAVTPSSSTAFTKHDIQLSEPPTPTTSTFGTGILVRLSDGELAVRAVRKILRIDEKERDQEGKGKGQELTEGEEVEYRTDGCKAFDVRRRSC